MPFISTATFVRPPCSSFTGRPSFASTFTARKCLHSRRFVKPPSRLSKTVRLPNACSSAVSNGNGTAIVPSENTAAPIPPSPKTNSEQKYLALRRFYKLLGGQWRFVIPSAICAVLASICAVLEPLLFGRILATLAVVGSRSPVQLRTDLYKRIHEIIVTYVIEMISAAAFLSLAGRAADRSIRALREAVIRSTFRNDVAFFDRAGRANVERTASLQLRIVRSAFWDNLSEDRGIRAILEAIMGVILCLKLTGPIGIPMFLIILPTITSVLAYLGIRSGRAGVRVETREADFLSFISERMRGLRTLKAFGAEKKEVNDLGVLLDESEKITTSWVDLRSLTDCANRLNIYITIMIFFFFGGHMVSTGAMTYETFSSLIGFIWVLNYCMHGLQFTLTDMAKASVALTKVYSLLDDSEAYRITQASSNGTPPSIPNSFRGEVQFDNVSFSYPSRPDALVLNNVSLQVRPGQTIALVGDSGGGKSTIASLLCRFYAPTNGTVTLDDVDIQSIPADIYSKLLSVVDQEPFLFQGTIRDNIAYGMPDDAVADEEIVRAATEANAHEFIIRLHKGYDTVWHPGSNLSGGQRQRIAIARSLVKSPRILVLDEATSALDQESERMVQVALERIMKKRTTLIIAHRLSTVRSADQILFVKGGEILERGTFDELLTMPNGYFRTLVDSSSAFVQQPVE